MSVVMVAVLLLLLTAQLVVTENVTIVRRKGHDLLK
jgi:hypothetical protein